MIGGKAANFITINTATGATGTVTYQGQNGADTVTVTGAAAATVNSEGGADVIVGGDGADRINAGLGDDTLTGAKGADTLTGGAGADTFIFKGATTGTAGAVARVATLGVDTITDFTAADDVLKFSETDFGNLDGGAAVGTLDQAQVIVLASTAANLNTTNAQIDGTGGVTLTNGAFAVVGSNTAGSTVSIYFLASTATATNSLATEIAAGTAVKIADMALVGAPLRLPISRTLPKGNHLR